MQVAPITQQTALLSRAIAEGVVALVRGVVPHDVWQYLKLCLADAVGIAFASRHYEFSRKSLDSLGVLGSEGSSTIIGQPEPVALRGGEPCLILVLLLGVCGRWSWGAATGLRLGAEVRAEALGCFG